MKYEDELFTDEYYVKQIERYIKSQIDTKFYIQEERKPTKSEYESWFKEFVSKVKCEVTDYDLGYWND